jgi:hypothetical protein
MNWIEALKEWNKKNDKYVIPKKGSKEYEEVKLLMKKSDAKSGAAMSGGAKSGGAKSGGAKSGGVMSGGVKSAGAMSGGAQCGGKLKKNKNKYLQLLNM